MNTYKSCYIEIGFLCPKILISWSEHAVWLWTRASLGPDVLWSYSEEVAWGCLHTFSLEQFRHIQLCDIKAPAGREQKLKQNLPGACPGFGWCTQAARTGWGQRQRKEMLWEPLWMCGFISVSWSSAKYIKESISVSPLLLSVPACMYYSSSR